MGGRVFHSACAAQRCMDLAVQGLGVALLPALDETHVRRCCCAAVMLLVRLRPATAG